MRPFYQTLWVHGHYFFTFDVILNAIGLNVTSDRLSFLKINIFLFLPLIPQT